MKMKPLIVLVISFLVISCGNLKHSNFNKQKFTKLKSQKIEEDNHLISEENSAEKYFEVQPDGATESNTDDQEKLSDDIENNPNEMYEHNSHVNKENEPIHIANVKLEKVPQKPQSPKIGNPRDFEKLTEAEKAEAIDEFNRIYKIGLKIFLIALILIISVLVLGAIFLAIAFLIDSFFL